MSSSELATTDAHDPAHNFGGLKYYLQIYG